MSKETYSKKIKKGLKSKKLIENEEEVVKCPKANQSKERKEYLRKVRLEKMAVISTQIVIILLFIALWEILANNEIIDSFIMSSPSRILKTFLNLAQNDLIEHITVTCIETLLGFLLGTILGSIIAIILWWSKFISKVSEPFLVILNSLPKIALRTCNNHMGWSRYACNYSNGTCYFINCHSTRDFKWIYKYR